jgi:hypothetical protein
MQPMILGRPNYYLIRPSGKEHFAPLLAENPSNGAAHVREAREELISRPALASRHHSPTPVILASPTNKFSHSGSLPASPRQYVRARSFVTDRGSLSPKSNFASARWIVPVQVSSHITPLT